MPSHKRVVKTFASVAMICLGSLALILFVGLAQDKNINTTVAALFVAAATLHMVPVVNVILVGLSAAATL